MSIASTIGLAPAPSADAADLRGAWLTWFYGWSPASETLRLVKGPEVAR